VVGVDDVVALFKRAIDRADLLELDLVLGS
jgi:hypothetical protein